MTRQLPCRQECRVRRTRLLLLVLAHVLMACREGEPPQVEMAQMAERALEVAAPEEYAAWQTARADLEFAWSDGSDVLRDAMRKRQEADTTASHATWDVLATWDDAIRGKIDSPLARQVFMELWMAVHERFVDPAWEAAERDADAMWFAARAVWDAKREKHVDPVWNTGPVEHEAILNSAMRAQYWRASEAWNEDATALWDAMWDAQTGGPLAAQRDGWDAQFRAAMQVRETELAAIAAQRGAVYKATDSPAVAGFEEAVQKLRDAAADLESAAPGAWRLYAAVRKDWVVDRLREPDGGI
ncbi:MAG: hypothetical protein OXC11_00375 [Rhodospirillales bacterium]|nr:hypothetical protein [Rhodospirillales bacterium]